VVLFPQFENFLSDFGKVQVFIFGIFTHAKIKGAKIKSLASCNKKVLTKPPGL
jgi:hypothetical protein